MKSVLYLDFPKTKLYVTLPRRELIGRAYLTSSEKVSCGIWFFIFAFFYYEIGRGCTIYLMADEMERKTHHKLGAKQSIKSSNGNTTIQLKYSVFYTFIVFVFQHIDKLLTSLLQLRFNYIRRCHPITISLSQVKH